tara:strand:- start:3241 stop:4425 length:1185 start_codon:yes stop_codon:yes gene_type:complete
MPNFLTKNYHWIMLLLIWTVYTCFGIVSGSLAPISPLLITDLNFTYTQMGIILGFWQFIYIFTAMPTGNIIDKWQLKKSITIGIIVMLASMILRGLSIDFITLLLSVGLFSFGGPIASSGSPKLVATWFKEKDRGIASGIYATGPVIGNAIAFASAPIIAINIFNNWRGVSVIYGIILITVLIIWLLFAKNKPNNKSKINIQKISYKELIKIKTVQIIMLLSIIFFFISHSLGAWAPSVLIDKNFSITNAGYITSISTIVSLISLLFITSIFKKGKRKNAIIYILLISALASLGIAFFSGIKLIFSIFLIFSVKRALMPLSTLILMDHENIGPKKIGTAAGMFFASAEIGGFSGPFIIGFLRDLTNSHQIGFLFSSILCLTGILFAFKLNETNN